MKAHKILQTETRFGTSVADTKLAVGIPQWYMCVSETPYGIKKHTDLIESLIYKSYNSASISKLIYMSRQGTDMSK